MARQLATSSSWTARASASSVARISSGEAPACTAADSVRFIRSIAQKRLTAVGRVAAIISDNL
jgi:acyl-coenzyme A thioesterase PaaI-like protein